MLQFRIMLLNFPQSLRYKMYISAHLSLFKFRDFKSIKTFSKQFAPNKTLEIEVYADSTLVGFEVSYTTKCSHAGATLTLTLLGYTFSLITYDHRHWDETTNTWEVVK